jgi:hypothetical protein
MAWLWGPGLSNASMRLSASLPGFSLLALTLIAVPTPSIAEAGACPLALASRPAPTPTPAATGSDASSVKAAPTTAAPASTPGNDYRLRLRPTPFGWARLDHWCVWVEPSADNAAPTLWEQRWLQAVKAALRRWQELLPITLVQEPSAAQVRILRRLPPLVRDGNGQPRASHGRASLELVQMNRGSGWRLEPSVQVLLSPGQRSEASEATALHELGHAFGLWGHSDDPGDALAAVPGPRPVRELSPRDIATLRWLYGQPTEFGRLLGPTPEGTPRSGSAAGP